MRQFEFLQKYALGELDVDVAEFAERILADPNDCFAQAVIRISMVSEGRAALWERFMRRCQRVLGPLFTKCVLEGDTDLRISKHMFCSQPSCMEFAVNGICDQCWPAQINAG